MATAKGNIIIGGKKIDPYHVSVQQRCDWHHQFEIAVATEKIEGKNSLTIDNSVDYIGQFAEISINCATGNFQFKGLITSIHIDRTYTGDSLVVLSGYSPTYMLEDGEGTQSYEEKNLATIANEILATYPANLLNPIVSPQYTTPIPYVVRYKETNYQFLSRLAATYGEWLFYDGQSMVFGKLPNPKRITVTLGKDLSSFDYGVNMRSSKFKHEFYNYQENRIIENASTSFKPGWLDSYGKKSLDAANRIFPNEPISPTWQDASKDALSKHLVETRKSSILSDITFFKGKSTHAGVSIGGRVIAKGINKTGGRNVMGIIGNFRVTSVTHHLNANKDYSNTFEAMPVTVTAPPVNKNVFKPEAESQVAVVMDNNDPEKLGRVRVQFNWQKGKGRTTKVTGSNTQKQLTTLKTKTNTPEFCGEFGLMTTDLNAYLDKILDKKSRELFKESKAPAKDMTKELKALNEEFLNGKLAKMPKVSIGKLDALANGFSKLIYDKALLKDDFISKECSLGLTDRIQCHTQELMVGFSDDLKGNLGTMEMIDDASYGKAYQLTMGFMPAYMGKMDKHNENWQTKYAKKPLIKQAELGTMTAAFSSNLAEQAITKDANLDMEIASGLSAHFSRDLTNKVQEAGAKRRQKYVGYMATKMKAENKLLTHQLNTDLVAALQPIAFRQSKSHLKPDTTRLGDIELGELKNKNQKDGTDTFSSYNANRYNKPVENFHLKAPTTNTPITAYTSSAGAAAAGGEMTPWIRLSTNYASGDRGVYFVPEIGDEVYVDFEHGNPDRPYVAGARYHGNAKPEWADPQNDLKAIKTRSGHTLLFNDEAGGESITITDRNGNQILIDTVGNNMTITALETMNFNAKNMNFEVGQNVNWNVGQDESKNIGQNKSTNVGNSIEAIASNTVDVIGQNKVNITSGMGNSLNLAASGTADLNASSRIGVASGGSISRQAGSGISDGSSGPIKINAPDVGINGGA